jgi:hypothetical protein
MVRWVAIWLFSLRMSKGAGLFRGVVHHRDVKKNLNVSVFLWLFRFILRVSLQPKFKFAVVPFDNPCIYYEYVSPL